VDITILCGVLSKAGSSGGTLVRPIHVELHIRRYVTINDSHRWRVVYGNEGKARKETSAREEVHDIMTKYYVDLVSRDITSKQFDFEPVIYDENSVAEREQVGDVRTPPKQKCCNTAASEISI